MKDDSMKDNSIRKWAKRVIIVLLFFIVSSFIESSFIVLAAEPAAAAPQYLFQLSYSDAEQAISRALVKRGAGSRISASINGDHEQPLFSYSKPISVQIRGLQYEKSGRWSANLLFVADGNVLSAMPIAGRYQEMVQVPVLLHEVRNGDVIEAQDLEMRDFPVTRIRTDTIIDTAQLIGKSPIMSISPSRPVRLHEIESPAVVQKNGIVTIRFTSPGIEITATGQALEQGAKGDVIEVRNTVSRKIIHAVIADVNTVNVIAPGEPYAAN